MALNLIQNNHILLPNFCKRGCIFCFCNQQGPCFKENKYFNEISVNEYISNFKFLDCNENIEIVGGDVFNHKYVYDIIIELIKFLKNKNKKPTISISSTFADFDLSKLKLFKLYDHFGLRINAITFDTNFKNKIMRGGWNEIQTNIIKKLISYGFFSNIVIWNFGSLKRLKKDLDILNYYSKNVNKNNMQINLTHPSITKYSNLITKQFNEIALKNYDDAIEIFKKKLKEYPDIQVDIIRDLNKSCFDEIVGVDDIKKKFCDSIKNAINYLQEKKIDFSKVAFIANNSSYNYGLKYFPNLNWINVKSNYFEGDIVASSLLGFNDIEETISLKNNSFEYYIMTKKMLIDNNDADLFKRKITDFENKTSSKTLFF